MSLEIDTKEAWEFLNKRIELFPSRCCKFAVREMYAKGYQIVVGTVRLDNYCDLSKRLDQIHYWNYDPNTQKHFDITASQLNIHLRHNKELPKIAIWSEDEETIYSEIRRGLEPHQVI